MALILHMSDPHFGTEQPEVAAALRQLVAQHGPELLILSGDITQRAKTSQFRAARQYVDSLGIPQRIVIPGNHDIPLFDLLQRLVCPYARYCRAFGPELEPVYSSAELLVIAVNTTRRLRHIDGEVSAQQVQRVAARLQQADARQLRIVVTHQPVSVLKREDQENLLHGHVQAVLSWAEAGADLVLGGHIHLPYVYPLHQRSGVDRRMWAVQAGTALSTRLRRDAGNSINLIHYDADAGALDGAAEPAGAASQTALDAPGSGQRLCRVERWDFMPAAGRFERVDVDQLACDAA